MSLGWALLILAIYVLATARLTRLINSDTILDGPRLAIERRARNTDASETERRRWAALSYWAGCPWCAGLWICLASAYLPTHLIGLPWWSVFPLGLAASYLIGIAAPLADDEDVTVEETD